jgi:hypothetical protein
MKYIEQVSNDNFIFDKYVRQWFSKLIKSG